MPAHPAPSQTEIATFAGGCFWCLEAAFNQLQGVIRAESGYSNGSHPQPDYDVVCSGRSGHAEVVQVTYDPALITYRQLLEIFFSLHDPTTLNRQGNDVGTQYRSAVFTHDPQQAAQARALIEELSLSRVYAAPIVTEVRPVDNYHPAEDEHQGYVSRHPFQGYCVVVVAPKLSKFRQTFSDLLRSDAK